MFVRLVEVQTRRGFDAVRPVTEVHLVAVNREDLLLGVALFDLNRQDHLADFAVEEFLLREAEFIEISSDLLCQRACALFAPALDDVDCRGDENAPDVHAEMAIELRVLGRDNRLPQQRVDIVVADDDAPLRRKLADHLSVRGIDPRNRARRIVVERRHLRQVAGVREQHAAQNSQHRRQDEQRDDAGLAGDFDDDVCHDEPRISRLFQEPGEDHDRTQRPRPSPPLRSTAASRSRTLIAPTP